MKNSVCYDTKIGRIEIEENGEAITKIDYVSKDIETTDDGKETELIKEAIKQLN